MRFRRYEPINMMHNRPYARAVRQIIAGNRQAAENETAQIVGLPPRQREAMAQLSDTGLAVNIMSHHFRKANPPADLTPQLYLAHVDEIDRVNSLFQFLRCGRQILQFDPGLTTEFRHTDLDGMMAADIELPWDAFYLTFAGPDAPFSEELPIDGCMIYRDDLANNLIIAPFLADEEPWTGPRRHQSLILTLPLSGENDLPVALHQSAERLDDSVRMLGRSNFPAEFEHMVETILAACQSRKPLVERLLNLVGNALLFLAARPEDTVIGWQEGAPAGLVEKADAGGVGADKARQALLRDGFSKVRFFKLPGGQAGAASEGLVRPHWRRGHWKRQPYGPQGALRKIIRIRPYLTGSSPAEVNERGRIHIVRASDQRHSARPMSRPESQSSRAAEGAD